MRRTALLVLLLAAASLSGQVVTGMSEADLLAAKGAPTSKITLGTRTIYRWGDLKVTVNDGHVSSFSGKPPDGEGSGGVIQVGGAAAVTVKGSSKFRTPWQSEEQFIVEDTSAELAEMVLYASSGKIPGAGGLKVDAEDGDEKGFHVRIEWGAGLVAEADLPPEGSILAPEAFLPVGRAVMKIAPVPAVSGDGPPLDILGDLTNPTVAVIAAADKELSERLAQGFASPRTHEQAALLIAAFALREHSGKFYQVLPELCGMSAHLAFAGLLRAGAPASAEGAMAEAALYSLTNNSAESQRLLAAAADSQPGVRPWRRALTFRDTGDVRGDYKPEDLSLFERVERQRIIWSEGDSQAAIGDIAAMGPVLSRDVDWDRLLSQLPYGVPVGHALLETHLTGELREIQAAMKLELATAVTKANLVPVLNQKPLHCVFLDGNGAAQVAVLGWSHWAGFLERHLCSTITSDYDFLERKWAVPDDAKQYAAAMDAEFSGLDLYPFVRRLDAVERIDYQNAEDDSMAVILREPQAVAAAAWNYLWSRVRFAPAQVRYEDTLVADWRPGGPPRGTAYDVNPRLHERSLTRDAGAKGRLEALHRLSPWAYSVTKAMLESQYGGKPPAQAMIGAYSNIADYNANACADIAAASADDSKAYVDWMTKAAVLNPTYYYNLAKFLEKAKRAAEAAAAYETAIGADRNEVRVSDTCRWLVMYYEDNGRPQDATKLADRAAEVYSAAGLLTKAALLERRRQLGDALSIEDDLYDRYKEPRYLLLFICRAQAASPPPELAQKLRQDAERFVTGGLEPAHLGSFSGPPGDGTLISYVNQSVIDGGLSFGDIVVALHGYRVRNFRSYVTIRNMWGEAPLDMVVWRAGHYLECKPNPAHGRFGVDFDDYIPK